MKPVILLCWSTGWSEFWANMSNCSFAHSLVYVFSLYAIFMLAKSLSCYSHISQLFAENKFCQAFSLTKHVFKNGLRRLRGVQTTKAQTSLRIRADWSAPLLFAIWKISYLHLLLLKLHIVSEEIALGLVLTETPKTGFVASMPNKFTIAASNYAFELKEWKMHEGQTVKICLTLCQ